MDHLQQMIDRMARQEERREKKDEQIIALLHSLATRHPATPFTLLPGVLPPVRQRFLLVSLMNKFLENSVFNCL